MENTNKNIWLKDFVQESLNIEDIWREPTEEELSTTCNFVTKPFLCIQDLIQLVYVYQPDAVIRDNKSLRVWIGGREAPTGGKNLLRSTNNLLIKADEQDPWKVHAEYEHLHPFTDGNGRSGRALWAHIMYKHGYDFRYKFLQMYYYQTLNRFSKDQNNPATMEQILDRQMMRRVLRPLDRKRTTISKLEEATQND